MVRCSLELVELHRLTRHARGGFCFRMIFQIAFFLTVIELFLKVIELISYRSINVQKNTTELYLAKKKKTVLFAFKKVLCLIKIVSNKINIKLIELFSNINCYLQEKNVF